MDSDSKAVAWTDLGLALDAASIDPSPMPEQIIVARKPSQFGEGIVRPAHAIDAARFADDIAAFAYQDTSLLVTTRLTEVRDQHFVLLTAGSDSEGTYELFSAYRLYGDRDEITHLAQDARRCFRVFLERFAVPYKAKGRWALFTPVVGGPLCLMSLPIDAKSKKSSIGRGPEKYLLNVSRLRRPGVARVDEFPDLAQLDRASLAYPTLTPP